MVLPTEGGWGWGEGVRRAWRVGLGWRKRRCVGERGGMGWCEGRRERWRDGRRIGKCGRFGGGGCGCFGEGGCGGFRKDGWSFAGRGCFGLGCGWGGGCACIGSKGEGNKASAVTGDGGNDDREQSHAAACAGGGIGIQHSGSIIIHEIG